MGGVRRFFTRVFKVITAVMLFYAVNMLIFHLVEGRFKKEVGADIPAIFPVLVITRDVQPDSYRAQIIEYRQFAQFKEEHPRYSLLVPQGKEQGLRKQIIARNRSRRNDTSWDSPDPWEATFHVKQISPSRQAFEVHSTWDDDRVNIGWYEATEKELFPKFHMFYFGPGIVLPLFPVSLGITIFIWHIPWIMRRWRRKKISPVGN